MLVGHAGDVICVRDSSGRLRSTNFFVQFSFGVLKGGALAMLGLNPGADWHISSRSFAMGHSLRHDEDMVHEANRMGHVEVYCNGELCSDVHVSARASNNGVILFHEDEGDVKGCVRPSSAVLNALKLVTGENRVEFRMYKEVFRERSGGDIRNQPVLAVAQANVWVYDESTRLVIFDIDGTITKADVQGYITSVYLQRYDFVHDGVTSFMNHLTSQSDNVKIIYVTSRPLEHKEQTKALLNGCVQGALASGPILMNMDSLTKALVDETVLRASAGMKSKLLQEVRECFCGSGVDNSSKASIDRITPFVMGFGNRPSDHQAYKKGALLDDSNVYLVNVQSTLRSQGQDGAVYNGYECERLRNHITTALKEV